MAVASRKSFVFSQDYTVRVVIDCATIKQSCSVALCSGQTSLPVAVAGRAGCLSQSCFGRLGSTRL